MVIDCDENISDFVILFVLIQHIFGMRLVGYKAAVGGFRRNSEIFIFSTSSDSAISNDLNSRILLALEVLLGRSFLDITMSEVLLHRTEDCN